MREHQTSVLVLEDDDLCLHMARSILHRADFNVICARDFFEAIYSLDAREKVDIALVDVNLPNGTPNGISFARAAQKIDPSLKVIFMSGNLGLREFRRLDNDEVFLRKPFAPSHLLEIVARTMWSP